jgi:hypothetical protein
MANKMIAIYYFQLNLSWQKLRKFFLKKEGRYQMQLPWNEKCNLMGRPRIQIPAGYIQLRREKSTSAVWISQVIFGNEKKNRKRLLLRNEPPTWKSNFGKIESFFSIICKKVFGQIFWRSTVGPQRFHEKQKLANVYSEKNVTNTQSNCIREHNPFAQLMIRKSGSRSLYKVFENRRECKAWLPNALVKKLSKMKPLSILFRIK